MNDIDVKVNVGTPVGGYKVEFFSKVSGWRVTGDGFLEVWRGFQNAKGEKDGKVIATIRDWNWVKEDE